MLSLLMPNERQKDSSRRLTVNADRTYDAKYFIARARALNVTAHCRKSKKGRRSNVDGKTTQHAGYALSLSPRRLIERTFGWLKQTGPLAQVKLRGLANCVFVFSCAAHNLLRLRGPLQITQQSPQQNCG